MIERECARVVVVMGDHMISVIWQQHTSIMTVVNGSEWAVS